mmetsp:Transcript_12219/g.31681  ORF Transcript_12219/g.31681 Transcript_12219/m.31681 type:complete len:221 (-) Transcript_12219:703-1365(-)
MGKKMPYMLGYNWVKKKDLPWNKEKLIRNVDVEGLRFRLVDAKGLVLGRLASQLSKILQGKDKPTYDPSKDRGDVVVVVNAKDIELTGRKFENKVYRWHTGYPGGLKERTVKEQWERDPTEILRRAVSGMLPKNNLRKARNRKLRIFPGPDHDFDESKVELIPYELPERGIRMTKRVAFLDQSQMPDGIQPLNREWYEKMCRLYKIANPYPKPVEDFEST